jgi:YspA, cpYpsA-related SLOG family
MLSLQRFYLDIRIVVSAERAWACDELVMLVFQQLIARYRRDIVIVHGGCPGVDESFYKACKSLGVAVEVRLAEWPQTGMPTIGTRNCELIKPGADLCIALHRSVRTSQRTRDCALQAIQAGISTFLIEDEQAIPIWLPLADARLAGPGDRHVIESRTNWPSL